MNELELVGADLVVLIPKGIDGLLSRIEIGVYKTEFLYPTVEEKAVLEVLIETQQVFFIVSKWDPGKGLPFSRRFRIDQKIGLIRKMGD